MGGGKHRSLATPAVRRIAAEHKVTIENVKGTGKDGRVMKEDILKHISSKHSNKVTEGVAKKEVASVPHPVSFPASTSADKVVPIRGMTRLMVSSMKSSLTIPHFGYCDEYSFNQLHIAREQLKPGK